MEQSAGREGWGAAGGKTRSDTGLDGEFGDENLTGLVQAHSGRKVSSHGRRRMQRDADGAMVGGRFIEQRMHVANRQHHGQQQQQDAGGNSGLTDSSLRLCPHAA